MMFKSKSVSLLLAGSVGGLTGLFLSLVKDVGFLAVFVGAGISFSATLILVYVTLEFLVFKEINLIYESLKKIRKKHIGPDKKEIIDFTNNPDTVNKDILNYINQTQKEIYDLKKMEAFRREFIADVSHELKTPIFSAQGFVLTLLDGAIDDDKVKYRFLEKAAKNLSGLAKLVEDLMVLSKIEAGVINMEKEIFNLAVLARDVADHLEEKAKAKSISIHINIVNSDEAFVFADPIRITQVFTNLISNAINYNKESGEVQVSLEVKEKNVLTRISDNGIGIPDTDLKRIFERFYRVEKSRSKEQGGTGLGLAIVKHILEGHRSKIKVESKIGEGSTFSFKLEKAVFEDEQI